MFLLLTCRNGETVAQTMISTAPSPSSWGWPSTARSQDLSSTININQISNAPEWRVWTVLHLRHPQQGPARRPHNINYLGHSAVSNKTVSSWGGSREREVLIPQFRLIGSNIFSTNIISFPYSAYFPNVTLSKYRCRNVQSSIMDFPLKHPALHYVTVLWFCLIKIGEVIESL